MKTIVKWSGQASTNSFQFVGSNQEGHQTAMSARDGVAEKTASSPKEVVAMGQAACTGIDVVSTLKKMREPLSDLQISCDVAMTAEYPQVFETCEMIYEVSGDGLNASKVAHAVEMSLIKYCGVSAMIERSGCKIVPRLMVNGNEVSIWDPDARLAAAMSSWVKESASKCPRGVALVVGGSRGIGRSLVARLSGMGFAVLSASRGPNKGAACSNEFDRLSLDVSNSLSREAFASLLSHSGVKLSLVIYNSGYLDDKALPASQVEYAEMRAVFETNLFGIVETNRLLHKNVSAGGAVLFVSSYMGLPDRNEFTHSSYRLSKCALTLYAREFGKEMLFRGSDIAVAALHPGSVDTAMNPRGSITTADSSRRILLLIDPNRRSEIIAKNGELWMVSNTEESISHRQV